MSRKIKGRRASFVINDEVTGNDMARANQELAGDDRKNAIKRLMIKWSAEEILRVQYATRLGIRCKCPSVAQIDVHPLVAYNLAKKSPGKEASTQAVSALAAQYGGKVPLHSLALVLGPWDSLVEELRPRRH